MEKERFLVEVTVKGEKGWKAIHMCGSKADAVPGRKMGHVTRLLRERMTQVPRWRSFF